MWTHCPTSPLAPRGQVSETAEITAKPSLRRGHPRRRGLLSSVRLRIRALLLLFLVLAPWAPAGLGNPLQQALARCSASARRSSARYRRAGATSWSGWLRCPPADQRSPCVALAACITARHGRLIAGFFGGLVDQLLMRSTTRTPSRRSADHPVVTVLGTGAGTLIIGIGIAMAPGFAGSGGR